MAVRTWAIPGKGYYGDDQAAHVKQYFPAWTMPWCHQMQPHALIQNTDNLFNLARTFTLTGVVVGTEVRLHVDDGNVSDGLGTEIDGVESAASSTVVLDYTYTGDVIDAVLVLIKPGYRYQRLAGFQLGQSSQSFPVQQVLDRAYSNPA